MTLVPSQKLCFALYSAAHAMQSAYAPLLEPLGLTYPQYLVISALAESDGALVGQLGAALHLESNTLTPLLKRMEQAGWLRRQRDTGDERQVRVTLTGKGQDLVAKAAAIPGSFAEKTGLSLPEIVRLRDQLITLRDRLRPRSPKESLAAKAG